MPIYLRQFYIQQLITQRTKENADYEKARRKQKGVSRLDIPTNPRFK